MFCYSKAFFCKRFFFLLYSLWFSFYYTGEQAEHFTPHRLSWDGKKALCTDVTLSPPPSLCTCRRVSPSLGHVLVQLTPWTNTVSEKNLWSSADLLRCFLAVSICASYSSLLSGLSPWVLSASAGSRVNVIFFSCEIIGQRNIAGGIFYVLSPWQSGIQVNVCSHRRCCARKFWVWHGQSDTSVNPPPHS